MRWKLLSVPAVLATAMIVAQPAKAVELKISRQALERTLKAQLFTGAQGRYYLQGDARSACYVYADAPSVAFAGDRIVVRVHTSARLGAHLHGACIGVSLAPNAAVSMVPDAEGESIGFRDARVESVSDSRELNFILMPFLSRKIPSSLKINAAAMLRQLLAQSLASTGYVLTLDHLKIHSMLIEGDHLIVDLDGDLSVN
jgi:hypothetical protein